MPQEKSTPSKAELTRMAEIWAIVQKLPVVEQIAILYYMKGRFDSGEDGFDLSFLSMAKA